MVEQAQIAELAATLAEIPFTGGDGVTARAWSFGGVDPMSGCISYRCAELEITVYCTPGWNRDDAWIVASPGDDLGNPIDDDRAIPFAFQATAIASAVYFRSKISPYLRELERAYPEAQS